jgi:hypothetical protein
MINFIKRIGKAIQSAFMSLGERSVTNGRAVFSFVQSAVIVTYQKSGSFMLGMFVGGLLAGILTFNLPFTLMVLVVVSMFYVHGEELHNDSVAA